MLTVHDNVEAIRKYGLDCVIHYGNRVEHLVERAAAKFYILEYQKEHELLPVEVEHREHLFKLSHFLVDYLTITAMGESRHALKSCVVCQYNHAGDGHSRIKAYVIKHQYFHSYDSAHQMLMHVFYDHSWKSGFGGWRWGDVVWLAYRLLNAARGNNLKEMAVTIDAIMQVQHNNGTVLASKYEWLAVDTTTLQAILNAKLNGEACCLQFLDSVAAGDCYIRCRHSDFLSKSFSYPSPLKGGVQAIKVCVSCHKSTTKNHLSRIGLCKTYCATCKTCNLRRCVGSKKVALIEHKRIIHIT